MKAFASFALLFIMLLLGLQAWAQFEEKTINVGNIGLNVSNAGTVGRPNVRNDPQGPPSMEYPRGSGVEHLFEAGLWIGAIKNGQISVSTGAVDDASGYAVGKSGFEFTPMPGMPVISRSSLPGSEFFSTAAISHQEYVLNFTDEFTIVPGSNQPINNHLIPLNARVRLETYAWNFPFADYFVILNYTITNNDNVPWDSVWVGQWSDLVVRNVKVTNDRGGAFFNKGSLGFDDTLHAMYAYDVIGDRPFTNSYGALQFLGILFKDQYIHPNNPNTPFARINGNYWLYNVAAPANDLQRYDRMKTMGNFGASANLQTPGNRVQLIAGGPIARVEPGESFSLVMAAACAPQLDDTPLDTWYARSVLRSNLGWAKRTFVGEDTNENGILDPGEDLNGNGVLDRYILPEPPPPPKVRFEPSENKVTVYWDRLSEDAIDPITKIQDFEGYRVYRTKPGDDLRPNLLANASLIGQWDKPGNAVGFNNGFDAIRLNTPIKFPEDTVEYWYKYEAENVLNGWQYMYIVTAFDEGDASIGLESLESSLIQNAYRVFAGTEAGSLKDRKVGVYPNPYRTGAAWDGTTSRSKKITFYNLPERAEIRVYTLSGDAVATLFHDSDAAFNGSTIGWYNNFGGDPNRVVMSGGEHSWDVLSDDKQNLASGLYLFSVKDLKTNEVQTGKFAIIK
ncbi:MAG: hypothetical protein ACK417_06895 [Bacteroidia bacterium]